MMHEDSNGVAVYDEENGNCDGDGDDDNDENDINPINLWRRSKEFIAQIIGGMIEENMRDKRVHLP